MSTPSFDAVVAGERSHLQRLAAANPGVAYLGEETGQLALHLDPPVEGVARATITATTPPPVPIETAPYYHATVAGSGSGGSAQDRAVFRHPFPALDWIAETVPDFDLLETQYVDPPAESEPAGD